MGPPRHLSLIPTGEAERVAWPVPFADGIEVLRGFKGRTVAVLVSGDPFWYGAGQTIADAFPGQWRAMPNVSVFARVAAHMGWSVQDVGCIGLHAAPFGRIRPELSPGTRLIVTLRDGPAVSAFAGFLRDAGFDASTLTVCEAMGGPRERVTRASVADAIHERFAHPVAVAVEVAGNGAVIARTCGLADDLFETDGVMTKRPIRAITLSTLAPKPHEHLWDVGAGSGSIALEWLLAHPTTRATAFEPRADRVAIIAANADRFGVAHRLTLIQGQAPDAFDACAAPDAIFVGGGLSDAVLKASLAQPARLVINAVTLEGEAVLGAAQAEHGGDLMRIDIAQGKPLGQKRAWAPSYPVVQWSLSR